VHTALSKKITLKHFWTCWFAVHAQGVDRFAWGNYPDVVCIGLYHRWYTVHDLVIAFFLDFFRAHPIPSSLDVYGTIDTAMDLLDAMHPYNDLFADAFLTFSLHDVVRLWYKRKDLDRCSMRYSTVVVMVVVLWPMSLSSSREHVWHRAMGMAPIIERLCQIIDRDTRCV
jgi:hypothetical protein